MATFTNTRGYFLMLNSFLLRGVQWQRVDMKEYARIFHRRPIKILTSEEAVKTNKSSLFYEEPQTLTRSNEVERHSLKTRRKVGVSKHSSGPNYSSSNVNKEFDQKPKFSQQVKLYNNASSSNNPTRGQIDLKKDKAASLTSSKDVKLGSSADLKTIMVCGERIKMEVITDKLIAERKLSSLAQSVKSSKARKASGKILLEGERLIADAMKAGVQAEALFFSNTELLASLPLQNQTDCKLYQVRHNIIQLWSDLSTSPGIMGIFNIAEQDKNVQTINHGIPLTIICDSIRDPGNMGSVIRCAAAVGCKVLIATPECVDVWDPKVLRSAAGAHFRTKLALNIEWDLIAGQFITHDTTVILADAPEKECTRNSVEANEEETVKNLLKVERGIGYKTVEITETGNTQHRDPTYLDKNLLRIYRKLPLPHFSYSEMQLDSDSVALVIGGETHGLSSAAHKLAYDFNGMKVFIPLENEVDSLNAGVAVGVLAYEIRRRILQRKKNSNEAEVVVAT